MKAVFYARKENYAQANAKLYADDEVSRQSITARDSASLGMKKEGYYIQIDGSEASLKKAAVLLKGLAEEVKGDEAENIMGTIEQQESSASEGFGALFG